MGEGRPAAVIVSWNGAELLPGTLASLEPDASRVDVVVVDNASTDGSADLVAREHPRVELVRNPRNDGWARGNNIGIRRALERGARWIALFNTDARPAPGWPQAVDAAFAGDDKLAAIGFTLFEGLGADVDRAFAAAVARPRATAVRAVDFVTGAAMVLRASALHEVGLIDEAYFMYCDDMDLCERLRRAGWRLGQVPVPVRHFSEASSRRVPRRTSYLSMRNSLRFYLRYRGPAFALKHMAGVLKIALGATKLQDPHDIRHRYRPGPAVLNLSLWLAAVAWNAVHLPATLWARPRVTV
jgi:GT2 family glycosyltransferase